MKKILISLFISWSSFGQTDSLLKVLKKNQQNDTTTCFILSQIIDAENDHRVWVKYNEKLIELSLNGIKRTKKDDKLKITYLKFLAIAYQNQGAYFNYSDDYNQAIDFYNKSLAITLPNKFFERTSSNYQNIGTAYDFLGNLELALQNFNKALDFAYKSESKEAIAYVLTDLGYAHNSAGNNKKAIDYNFQALKLFKEMADEAGIERTCFAIGRIFDAQKEFIKSEVYYQESLKIAVKNADFLRQGQVLNSLANTNFQNKKYISAQKYAQKSLEIALKNDLVAIEGVARKHLGEIALTLNENQEALQNLTLASTIFKKGGNLQQLTQVQVIIAKNHIKNKNNQSAILLLKEAYQNAKLSKYPSAVKECSELVCALLYKQKEYEEAYKYLKEAKELSEELFRDENKNAALKAEFKFESELNESKIKSLAQQKQISELESNRKTTLIYSILGGIIALAAIAYFSFTRFRTNKENEILQTQLQEAERRIAIEQKATESELKALKSQMNPHFMFNALNSIQEQFMYGDKMKANEQMGNFTYLTRQILSVSGKKKINLSTEVEILTKYLELEKMRFSEGFNYQIILGENIDEDYHQIPPMLIQPFVENSIKHGLLHKIGEKKLSIWFDLDETEENLICIVEDNGIGRKKSFELKTRRVQQHESFSTSATEERLKLMNNDLKKNDSIVYDDLPDGGTKVKITIPI